MLAFTQHAFISCKIHTFSSLLFALLIREHPHFAALLNSRKGGDERDRLREGELAAVLRDASPGRMVSLISKSSGIIHTHAHTCTHTCTHMHTHAHTRTHMRTHAHTCTHTHTHTCTHMQSGMEVGSEREGKCVM